MVLNQLHIIFFFCVASLLSLHMDLPSGSAPAPNFFRDKIYNDALLQNKPVPWDVRRHQPSLELTSSLFHGKVLDVGCGLGDNARWIASLQNDIKVTAVDFAPTCIIQAVERGTFDGRVQFIEADVFELSKVLPIEDKFDVLLDSAVFHCIGDDEQQRKYIDCVTPYIKTNGILVMLVFSDKNADPWLGPRRISTDHAKQLWSEAGWTISSINDDVYYIDVMGRNDGKGGHALLMTAIKNK